jgi:hypothetical protein
MTPESQAADAVRIHAVDAAPISSMLPLVTWPFSVLSKPEIAFSVVVFPAR